MLCSNVLVIIIIINIQCSLVAAILWARGCWCVYSCQFFSRMLQELNSKWAEPLLIAVQDTTSAAGVLSYLLWCYIASGCATGDPHRVSSVCHVLNSPPALENWLSCRMVLTSQDCMSLGISLWETVPYHLVWSLVLRDADRICLVIECGDGRCHFHKQDQTAQ